MRKRKRLIKNQKIYNKTGTDSLLTIFFLVTRYIANIYYTYNIVKKMQMSIKTSNLFWTVLSNKDTSYGICFV